MEAENEEAAPMPYRKSLMKNVISKVCWCEWSRNEEEEPTGYGSGTGFEDVLDPDVGVMVDLSNPMCPKIRLDDREQERLMRPFRKSLIVKLMGRQLSYGFMAMKLKQIWRKGDLEVFDLENDFYLVSFQSGEDYMEALTGGPWVIADASLNIARCKPEFNPRKEKFESMVAWVRIPDLPTPIFDKKVLLNVGNTLGKAIRFDVHTAQRTRGKFARMCVELDLKAFGSRARS